MSIQLIRSKSRDTLGPNVICLDNSAAIAAFQKNPPPSIEIHRDRVRAFLENQISPRIIITSVALSEYLFKADRADLETEIRKVIGERMFAPAFDEHTAEIAANIGRSYAAGRGLGDVAKDTGHDRTALKADLLIVATALQHSAQSFLTSDPGCHRVAEFAKLNSYLISALPDRSAYAPLVKAPTRPEKMQEILPGMDMPPEELGDN